MPENKKFRICSLFSGCGGFDLGFVGGFKHLGYDVPALPFKVVYANDFDAAPVSVYRENFRHFNHREADCITHKDIREVDPEKVPDFDVLLAGFPCQPFSNAGNRKGVNDHRGTLFEEVFKFVRFKKPDVVILENVRGILSSKMQDGTPVPEEIIKRLRNAKDEAGDPIGYNVSEPILLNASDFGVPQNRYRVIIIATRKGSPELLTSEYLSLHSLEINDESKLLKRVLKYRKTLPNVEDVWNLSPQQIKLAPHIKRSWKDIPYELLPPRFQRIRDDMKKYHAPNFYRRFGYNEICGTITASAQPENCGILHPVENRRYNIREIARIQSFPDNFTFNSVSIPNKYKVIGNAVPPVFAHAIANLTLSLLQETDISKVIEQIGPLYASKGQQLLAM